MNLPHRNLMYKRLIIEKQKLTDEYNSYIDDKETLIKAYKERTNNLLNRQNAEYKNEINVATSQLNKYNELLNYELKNICELFDSKLILKHLEKEKKDLIDGCITLLKNIDNTIRGNDKEIDLIEKLIQKIKRYRIFKIQKFNTNNGKLFRD